MTTVEMFNIKDVDVTRFRRNWSQKRNYRRVRYLERNSREEEPNKEVFFFNSHPRPLNR